MGVQNAGQGPIEHFFQLDPSGFYSTGAGAGSGGVDAVSDTGTPLGGPVVVTIPGASSQPPQLTAQVLTSSTEVPPQAAEYAKKEPISGVDLNIGGQGADGRPFGQWAADLDQSTFHPNSHGPGRKP